MFKKYLIHPTDHAGIQMLRYCLVVAIAAPIDLGGYIFFKSQLHMYVVLAATLSFTISLIVNYFLSVLWVFDRDTGRQRHIDAIAFGIIGFIGLGITDLVIWTLASNFGINYIAAKLVAFVIVFFWSFGARRALFHNPEIWQKVFKHRFDAPATLKPKSSKT